MGFKDNLKRKKDGSYILKYKSKESKKGDCIECGQNAKLKDLLFSYNTEDMQVVRRHIEEHLRMYSLHSTMKPIWCKKCAALIEYKIKIKYEKSN
jgi:hypothetical protein|tara:strand:+ start:481 stop:765 length:285 start_codon:yes stop_codon:yes gene_type:complete